MQGKVLKKKTRSRREGNSKWEVLMADGIKETFMEYQLKPLEQRLSATFIDRRLLRKFQEVPVPV